MSSVTMNPAKDRAINNRTTGNRGIDNDIVNDDVVDGLFLLPTTTPIIVPWTMGNGNNGIPNRTVDAAGE